MNEELNESATYHSIQAKMGELVELPLEALVVSEFNVRCALIDQAHVQEIAVLIEKFGFQKERAVRVNAIRNAAGQVIAYRLVAGAHRYHGAKHAKRSRIWCQLYYNLTEEEECLLDQMDNTIDDSRQRVHFLDESEHYKFLRDIKCWSNRQIARAKQVDRKTVDRRIKIAELPPEVKALIRGVGTRSNTEQKEGGDTVPTLFEAHFREICKLKNPANILLICKEIIASGQGEAGREGGDGAEPIRVMKQKEIEQRVAALVALEEQGAIDPSVSQDKTPIDRVQEVGGDATCPTQDQDVVPTVAALGALADRGTMSFREDMATSPLDRVQEAACVEAAPGEDSSPLSQEAEGDPVADPEEEEALAELRRFREQVQEEERAEAEACSEAEVESATWSTAEMAFDVVPRWLKFSSLQRRFRSLWPLLQALIGYALRFRNHEHTPGTVAFFLGAPDSSPQEMEAFLAQATGVGVRTVRRHLRQVAQAGWVRLVHQKRGRAPYFQVQWARLKKVYDQEATSIPYREGGLSDLPVGFTGLIQPTPLHELWFRQGRRLRGPDYLQRDVRRDMAKLDISPAHMNQLLQTYDVEHVALRLKELPLHQERYARQGKKITNLKAFFLRSLDQLFEV